MFAGGIPIDEIVADMSRSNKRRLEVQCRKLKGIEVGLQPTGRGSQPRFYGIHTRRVFWRPPGVQAVFGSSLAPMRAVGQTIRAVLHSQQPPAKQVA